ncbi:hypothetical protein [Mesorhizobium onobrychidis]|uniref:hypothetical protein n=1 Tax=Mesorhizobium onobrychidis TaxID=2775404 RepID=UPI002157F35D|nr:hypothetical protein [Mesorhizobium onobrychidis]
MKTLKSKEEFKTAWAATAEEDRAGIMKDCDEDGIRDAHGDFCKMAFELGGHQ